MNNQLKHKMQEQHTIIWDWNGTLLNDTDICIRSMNRMLSGRHLPQLSHERYRDVFTFPVKEYYKAIGFDFSSEPWDKAAIEFIELYLEALPECGLAEGAIQCLSFFRHSGYRQAIISAMQHDALLESVDALEISSFFDYIGGIGDHYGSGKIDNAYRFFNDFELNPQEVTLIGDTLHDAEVASELGCRCILIANGHQSKERLIATSLPVFDNLTVLEDYFIIK